MKHRTPYFLLAALVLLTGLLPGCAGAVPSESTAASSESVSTASETALPVEEELKLWCFDAGKADAFLLYNSAGAVLIDTGEAGFGKTVLAKLEELGIDRLSCLIITHFDKDHVGGAKKILNSIPVDLVLQSNCPKSGADAYENYLQALEKQGIEPVTVRADTELRLGDAVLLVNPPARETYPDSASNNSSLILTVTHGSNRLLFLGDAEDLRLTEFLQTEPGHFDLVKLPHHGRWHGVFPTLLEQITPRYAVLTASEDEPEDERTLTLLAEQGVQALQTRYGAFAVVSDGASITPHP